MNQFVRMKRSRLNEIADSIGIDSKKYKTKAHVIDAIKKFKLVELCENTTDPVSLENLDEIPFERLFVWNQNGKKWGADLISLKQMIDSGITRLPWSIDTNTGIQAAYNPEEYANKFEFSEEMKHDLQQKIKDYEIDVKTYEEVVPERTVLRFFIENIGKDMYITHIIDHIESLHYTRLIYFLRYCCGRCWHYIAENIEDDIVGNVQSLDILDFFIKWLNVFKRRREFLTGGQNAGLRMTVNIFHTLQHNLPTDKADTLMKLLLIEMQSELAG